MSYEPNTLLSRRAPKGDIFDAIRVIGPSPIRSASFAEWTAGSGEAMIVTPSEEFGPNETMPVAYAQAHYEVTYMPPESENTLVRNAAQKLRSPEDVFAEQAREAARPVAPEAPAKVRK